MAPANNTAAPSGRARRLALFHLGLIVATAAATPPVSAGVRDQSRGQGGDIGAIIEQEDISVDAFDMDICGLATFRPWQERESAFGCSSSRPCEHHDNALESDRGFASPRIVQGEDALEGEFPSFARLTISEAGGDALCGATLIDKNYLVTAAHCLEKALNVDFTVGTNWLSGSGGENRTADKWCLPEDFKTILDGHGGEELSGNDLAIIRFDEPIKYELNRIWPACVNLDARHSPTATCASVGFGRLSFDPQIETIPAFLQTLPARRSCVAPEFNGESCYLGVMEGIEGLQGTFLGDSGSPIVCYDQCTEQCRTQAFAVAAVSWGELDKPDGRTMNADFNLLRSRFLDLLKAASLEGDKSLSGIKCRTRA